MCSATEGVTNAIIPTLTHLLCSSASPGIMSHHRACVQLSRRLAQRFCERGGDCGPDIVMCLTALCDRHMDVDDVLNAISRCGPMTVALLRNVDSADVDRMRPSLCCLATVWCARGKETAQQDVRCCSALRDLVASLIISVRLLLKSHLACEKAIAISCTSFLTASFMDLLSPRDFAWMAEESLVVCQQAMMDREWPNSIKSCIVNVSLQTLLGTCGKVGQVASLPWHRTVAESGLDMLANAMSHTLEERRSSTYKQNMRFMLPWLGFISVMAQAEASWLPDLVTEELCTLLLQSTSDSTLSRPFFNAHGEGPSLMNPPPPRNALHNDI